VPVTKSRSAKSSAKKSSSSGKSSAEDRKKGASPKRPVEEDLPEDPPLADSTEPPTRVGLIRARHEFMKREIDQIREDLEAESDD
jgi:hypothetical protein